MDSPHEQVQNALLSRIVNNMGNLNDSIASMNESLREINKNNRDTELLSKMWSNYSKNYEYNLQATGEKREPI
ncbi:hypothetical protein HYPBUDRAFT_111251 [Hyphopichia burtonii NRRL Y-1933]|uniref:DASH complex subunit DAD4 n=1 Tax=Hyphopichia burtonii NRRL Y-1933 TaxID=984485 RepID=A0A1E4RHK6_9ASCO|nr:hypothetical protein HYPBUDRAFT_111251 [Hyphopichia burtonii NRRL Y-1933]ODV66753.1 hypothetical protein HYPBUDRAFT_111251 [Hyphopichia burtonii NRRL Y-1933]